MSCAVPKALTPDSTKQLDQGCANQVHQCHCVNPLKVEKAFASAKFADMATAEDHHVVVHVKDGHDHLELNKQMDVVFDNITCVVPRLNVGGSSVLKSLRFWQRPQKKQEPATPVETTRQVRQPIYT